MKVMDMVPESAVTTKGQVTIPKAARDYLKIRPGDKVRFFINHDGHMVVLPVVPVSKARGIIQYSGPPISIDEMDGAAAEAAVKRYERATSRR